MPALDLREIPAANLGSGQQDTFELFARDVLQHLGYRPDAGPDRGADGGRDLVVVEARVGVWGTTQVRWLVSAKHKAHSGTAVGPGDEPDILDRMSQHNCSAFLGFYSTLPTSGLTNRLTGLRGTNGLEFQVLDSEKIEAALLATREAFNIAQRYLPVSAAAWGRENPKPVEIFKQQPSLRCAACDKELLDPPSGIVVFGRLPTKEGPIEYEDVYWCCKGRCDRSLQQMRCQAHGLVDAWEDIPDIVVPTIYLKFAMSGLNGIQGGTTKWSLSAFSSLQDVLINVFPLVARELTSRERQRVIDLGVVPSWMGGLGD